MGLRNRFFFYFAPKLFYLRMESYSGIKFPDLQKVIFLKLKNAKTSTKIKSLTKATNVHTSTHTLILIKFSSNIGRLNHIL